VGTYLIYRIQKVLGKVIVNVIDDLGPIVIREYYVDQTDALRFCESVASQTPAGENF
jgi:uncharacterized FlaG/YvyC family protein